MGPFSLVVQELAYRREDGEPHHSYHTPRVPAVRQEPGTSHHDDQQDDSATPGEERIVSDPLLVSDA
jgi:hypothetical protein